jgi:hypothetical protein
MTTFSLVTEGITDQAILENILDCITSGQAVTKALRPLRDETDKRRVADGEFANWELMLEYLASEEILNAIQTSDFVVIQMDTDQCEHPNFGASLHVDGKLKDIEQIIEDCILIIKEKIHPNFPVNEFSKLLFAIPVLSSECWLVSIHDDAHKHTRKTVANCEARLKKVLAKTKTKYSKEYEIYLKLSSEFRKPKLLALAAKRTPCLNTFVNKVTSTIAIPKH